MYGRSPHCASCTTPVWELSLGCRESTLGPLMDPDTRPGQEMGGPLEKSGVAGRHTLPGEWRDPRALVGWASIGADLGRRPPAASASAVPRRDAHCTLAEGAAPGRRTRFPSLGVPDHPEPRRPRCPQGSEARAAPSGLLLPRRGACFRQRWLWNDSVPKAGPRDLRCPPVGGTHPPSVTLAGARDAPGSSFRWFHP